MPHRRRPRSRISSSTCAATLVATSPSHKNSSRSSLAPMSTRSTAELAASALKHDHLAVIVGSTTRGWGSVEAIIPMQTQIDPSETYALELVEYLTVRYDGLPIEGNGVVPDVDTSKSGWTSQLANYFDSSSMVSALESESTKAPLQ